MTLSGIEPATFRFVAQHLNHCATANIINKHFESLDQLKYLQKKKNAKQVKIPVVKKLRVD